MTTTHSSTSDPMLNTTVLGRYRVMRRLAVGGMGAVYLGRTEGAQGFTRPVVIKRVLPTLMGDSEIAQLFVREAQILSNLQHPNIVSVLDFGQQDDDAYVMVLEYVQGYQLAEWMRYLRRTSQAMPIDFGLHIIARVLDALHYAHTFRRGDGAQLRIIHRDVSPSNVLLGDTGLVKLLDFGIARVSGDETTFKTERPQVRGKLPYLALEVFKGAEPNERTDLYSAGVVLFEMLSGFNPFFGRETADIYFKILNTPPPSIHASRDDAPEELDEVIARALAKDATQRYESAAELATALRAMRSAPEEVIAQRLADRLRADFTPMASLLGVEPLADREAAWRVGSGPNTKVLEPQRAPSRPTARPSEDQYDPPTVQHTVQPELLAAAGLEVSDSLSPTSPPPPAFAGAPEVPKIQSDPMPAIDPPRAEARPLLGSAARIALVAALAAIVGAISAAALWKTVESGDEEPVIVIEREARAPDKPAEVAHVAPAPAPVEAVAPVEPSAPTQPAAPAPTEVEAAESEPPAAAAEPLPPNPKRLTRAFGRRQKQIEECFATQATELQGQPQIAVHFRIGTRGQVIDAALSPEPLAGTSLGRCLLGVARGASFGPQQVEISFRIPITAQKVER
jgi:serine/threonine protein kinase